MLLRLLGLMLAAGDERAQEQDSACACPVKCTAIGAWQIINERMLLAGLLVGSLALV